MKEKLCPVEKECGGCCYLADGYEEQLRKKRKKVAKLLGKYCQVKPIHGMEEPYYYRNKVHAVVAQNSQKELYTGIYKAKTHKVVSVEACLLEDETADKIIRSVKMLARTFRLQAYDEDRHTGLLRHILVRTAKETGEYMLVLVMAKDSFEGEDEFLEALLTLHPELKTVIFNVNCKDTTFVLGERERVVFGDGYIVDELNGMKFRISAKSFYQVNKVQTAGLYETAIKAAKIRKKDTVLDAYSGIGTIGLLASRHAKSVVGVELNPDAVRDARLNAKMNHVENVRFVHADAGRFMSELSRKHQRMDVVIVDPPRSGLSREFINSLIRLAPSRFVYISCNPETLERDLQILTKKGYRAQCAWPFDMFPWTEHVETVCLLSKKE